MANVKRRGLSLLLRIHVCSVLLFFCSCVYWTNAASKWLLLKKEKIVCVQNGSEKFQFNFRIRADDGRVQTTRRCPWRVFAMLFYLAPNVCICFIFEFHKQTRTSYQTKQKHWTCESVCVCRAMQTYLRLILEIWLEILTHEANL